MSLSMGCYLTTPVLPSGLLPKIWLWTAPSLPARGRLGPFRPNPHPQAQFFPPPHPPVRLPQHQAPQPSFQMSTHPLRSCCQDLDYPLVNCRFCLAALNRSSPLALDHPLRRSHPNTSQFLTAPLVLNSLLIHDIHFRSHTKQPSFMPSAISRCF